MGARHRLYQTWTLWVGRLLRKFAEFGNLDNRLRAVVLFGQDTADQQ